MTLRTITYTSLAAPDLTADDLELIHRTACALNTREAITGLLVFNGTHFLQIIEGAAEPIYALVNRLRRDARHSAMEIRDDAETEQRSFPDWSMELVRLSESFFEAKDRINDRLPGTIEDHVRNRVLRMTEAISQSASV